MNPLFNDSYHAQFAKIEHNDRPLWSIVVPTFNCASYLERTLESILSQALSPQKMEIIVVDDCSSKDKPKEVVRKYGRGRVKFFQQQKNVGKSKNYATGINLAQGHYIHMLHGDDTVNDGFYRKMEKLFITHPETSVALCQCNYMNMNDEVQGRTGTLMEHDGVLNNFIETIAVWQKIQPPSIVFKREVYETLGGYDYRLKYIEDWEFYVRAAVYFKYAYTPEILANYRVFANSSSQKSIKKGARINTIWQVCDIIDTYLPKNIKLKISDKRKEAISFYLLDFVPKLVGSADIVGYARVVSAIFKSYVSTTILKRLIRFTIQARKFNKV